MNTNARRLPLLLALSITVAAGTRVPAAAPEGAPATPASTTPKVDFVTIDRNADGGLSKEEAKPISDLDSAFVVVDADGNGSISPTEFGNWRRAGKATGAKKPDPATAPGGSAGAQHMPDTN